MDARRLIHKSAFNPNALRVMCAAFDSAWADISHHFNGDAEDARLRLAEATLKVAGEDASDVEQLKNSALQAMALAGWSGGDRSTPHG